ncbi:MAG: hypothetical protein IPP40_09220 [bacterium]|nr:hypothetical protein [bacterium]
MENTLLPVPASQSANALKHALDATDLLLTRNLKSDEITAFADIRLLYFEQYKPINRVEAMFVEKIAILNFRLFRLYKLEQMASSESHKLPLGANSIMNHLERISRYDSRIYKQLESLHFTLTRVQMSRR